jgi:dienelactone hydrolase
LQTASAFADKVNAAGGKAELFIYEQAGHGFLNTGEEGKAKRAHMGFPEPPAEAQDQAWQRVLAFFQANLKA